MDIFVQAGQQAIHERKLSVPDDIAVIGNDNMYICNYVYPELTTVALGSEIAGEQAIKKLLSLLEGQSVEAIPILPDKAHLDARLPQFNLLLHRVLLIRPLPS